MGMRGQATVEHLALVALVALLLVGAAPYVPGLAAALQARFGGGDAPPPAQRELALAAAALRGEAAAPPVEDAAVLLGDVLGPAAAARALDQLAARLAREQVGADPGSPERLRAGPVAGRVVTAAQAAWLQELLSRGRRDRERQNAALTLLAAATTPLGPEVSIPAAAAVAAYAGDSPGRALPPGSRTGDAVLCVPVDTPAGPRLAHTVLREGRVVWRKVERGARCGD